MPKAMIFFAFLTLTSCYVSFASDSTQLQDICVADLTLSARVNGHACKDPKDVQADDFFFSGLHMAGNISNPLGIKPTLVNVEKLAGLNTLGISMAPLDFAPYGVTPPHTHPRATEILLVIEGLLEVGFVTSNPENRHISKVLKEGDVFVFPVGLVHYQRNINNECAVAIVGLSSHNPGVISIPNTVFASNPKINADVLANAFQVDTNVVDQIQAKI